MATEDANAMWQVSGEPDYGPDVTMEGKRREVDEKEEEKKTGKDKASFQTIYPFHLFTFEKPSLNLNRSLQQPFV